MPLGRHFDPKAVHDCDGHLGTGLFAFESSVESMVEKPKAKEISDPRELLLQGWYCLRFPWVASLNFIFYEYVSYDCGNWSQECHPSHSIVNKMGTIN